MSNSSNLVNEVERLKKKYEKHDATLKLLIDAEKDEELQSKLQSVLGLKSSKKSSESKKPKTHHNAYCDHCNAKIIGHRYKCLVCPDYDLCMKCEPKGHHFEHAMMRIVSDVTFVPFEVEQYIRLNGASAQSDLFNRKTTTNSFETNIISPLEDRMRIALSAFGNMAFGPENKETVDKAKNLIEDSVKAINKTPISSLLGSLYEGIQEGLKDNSKESPEAHVRSAQRDAERIYTLTQKARKSKKAATKKNKVRRMSSGETKNKTKVVSTESVEVQCDPTEDSVMKFDKFNINDPRLDELLKPEEPTEIVQEVLVKEESTPTKDDDAFEKEIRRIAREGFESPSSWMQYDGYSSSSSFDNLAGCDYSSEDDDDDFANELMPEIKLLPREECVSITPNNEENNDECVTAIPPTPKVPDADGCMTAVPPTPEVRDRDGCMTAIPPTPKMRDSDGCMTAIPPTPILRDSDGCMTAIPPTPGVPDSDGCMTAIPPTPDFLDYDRCLTALSKTPDVADRDGCMTAIAPTPDLLDQDGCMTAVGPTPEPRDEDGCMTAVAPTPEPRDDDGCMTAVPPTPEPTVNDQGSSSSSSVVIGNTDRVASKLIDMGFNFTQIQSAFINVGDNFEDALNYILRNF